MKTENAISLFHDISKVFISSPFGYRDAIYNAKGKLIAAAGFHDGTDYSANGNSVPIYAIDDGVVLSEGIDSSGAIFCYIYFKKLGYVGLYYHLACTYISKGDIVNKNTKLGKIGRTGYATGIHLHFGWFKYSDYKKAYSKRTYENFNEYSFETVTTIIHTVRLFENLSKIAIKYGTTWQKIYEDNKTLIDETAKKRGVKDKFYNHIYGGERLVINCVK